MLSKVSAGPEAFKKIKAAFDFLGTFIEGQTFAASDSLTVADNALVATFEVAGFNISRYANVNKWDESLKKVTPGCDERPAARNLRNTSNSILFVLYFV